MKKSLMKMSAVLLAAFLAGGVMADDKDAKSEKKSTASAAASTSAVAKGLAGKLVSLKDGKLVDHALKGEPEFYVFYHSASW